MALRNFTQAGLGLLLGVAIGYTLRSPQRAVISPATAADLAAAKATAHSASGSSTSDPAADATNADGGPAMATRSLGERMKALLDRYNDAAARKDLEDLSESDINRALSLVAAMPKSADRDSLRAALYRAWAKKNPTAAWKAALADKLETDKNPLAAVAGEIARTQPDAAVGLALSLGMGSKRSEVLQQVFEEWGKVDIAGAVAYLNKHPDLPTAYWSIGQTITSAGEKDPLQAANLALSLTDQQVRSSAISLLMGKWAAHDPKAALAWARGISNPALQQQAIAQAISGWSSTDPQAALTEAQSIQDTSTRSSATQAAWLNWFQKDPSAAVAYLGSSGDEKMLENIGWYVNNSGSFTAQEATSLLDKLPDGKTKENIVRSLADTQIQKGQYTQALELLNNMPDSSLRDYTLQQLGKKWAESDPNAAAAWLRLQPDSSDRDIAVAGFAAALARTDPQGALQWADTIPDESVKSGALKNIALRWLSNDPARAGAWLASSGLSADEQKNLIETAQRSGADHTTYGMSVSKRR